MGLSSELLSEFAKITNDTSTEKTPVNMQGTIVKYNGGTYIKLDGSDLLTPIASSTATVEDGERVSATVGNHKVEVTGNLSTPSASSSKVEELGTKITEMDVLVANKVSTDELEAERARIDNLVANDVTITGELDAAKANIDTLISKNVTIEGALTANSADIDNLKTSKLDASVADIKYATIESLEATNAEIYNLNGTYAEFVDTTTQTLTAVEADITDLQTKKLDAESAEIKYANIDFTNIGNAAIEEFFAKSGLIENVIVGDQTITGKLVGVTISGDLIEGNTIVAEKLVIKGTDGLYYKLNTDGVTTETEQTQYNSINGNVIMASSITATKIAVDDLVAFDATIGGFKITEDAIYSGVKESVNNTTRGVYLDNTGQIAFGDSNNYMKYYRTDDGTWQLEVKASRIRFGSGGKSVEEEVTQIKEEVTTMLHINSSRGTVFKNDHVETILSVILYRGSKRIIDSATMKSVYGPSARLEWKWQRIDDDDYGVISASDSRFRDDGFTFILSPEDVDTKVTFLCELVVD